MGFGIRNTAQGIRNPTDDWNLEFMFHRLSGRLSGRIRNPRRRNPESFLTWGD